ncbi:MAG TPA: guanylate kinase [candidate division Zixibacteria bacterium]|nr:guanylate kinase [candidate division Zixibacteria bacterium]
MSNKLCRKGYLLVISSPSGGGKTTIYNALLAKGEPFNFSVSLTTRPPRPTEIDGVHYRFVSDEEFTHLVDKNEFAEWAFVHGHRYGTLRDSIEKAFIDGVIMILEIDVQGALQIKENYPQDSVLVFIAPPSIEETERRLRARETNTPEDIVLRIKNAIDEIANAHQFDYLVINDDLQMAISDVSCIARAEYLKKCRFLGEIWED